MVKENTMKQTEIGLLPEEWQVVELSELSSKIASGKSNTANSLNGTYPIYGSTGIIGIKNYYDYEGEKITVARVGANAGYINIIEGKYCISDNTLFVQSNDRIILIFLYKYLQSINLNKYVFGSGQPLITGTILKNIQIPLPPLPEQEAIAEALSDADAWIESLEQLIAKKRLIKQGAMQELLTPKKDWEVKKLGEVGKIYGGLSGKTKQDFGSGNSYYIPFMNVMKNVVTDKNFIEKVNLKQGETQNRVLKNDLLFNGSSETPEELGISSVLLDDIDNLYLNSFCFGFRIFDENVSPIFLSYIMRSPYGREVIFYLAQGATRYNLSKANFFNLEIAFPKSLTEQTRIATILSVTS